MSDEESRELLDAPSRVTQLPGGGVRVEKGGIVGVGKTLAEAAKDWASKFAVVFVQTDDAGN